MPFVSRSQARYMFAKHPELAKEFAEHTKSIKSLPEHKLGANKMKKKESYKEACKAHKELHTHHKKEAEHMLKMAEHHMKKAKVHHEKAASMKTGADNGMKNEKLMKGGEDKKAARMVR